MKNHEFSFGEWVLVDGTKSGQVIDYLGNGVYTIDFNGIWDKVNVDRIVKDKKYTNA